MYNYLNYKQFHYNRSQLLLQVSRNVHFLVCWYASNEVRAKGLIIHFQVAGSCNMPPLSLQLSHYIAMHHEVLTARFVLCTTCYSVNIWCKLQNISFTWSM